MSFKRSESSIHTTLANYIGSSRAHGQRRVKITWTPQAILTGFPNPKYILHMVYQFKMFLAVSLFASLCLGAGHTIRNGGGDAELGFIKTWTSLSRTFSVCLDPVNPCDLSENARDQIKQVLDRQQNCHSQIKFKSSDIQDVILEGQSCGQPLTLNNQKLFDQNGAALDSEAMAILAFNVLQELSCNQRLIASSQGEWEAVVAKRAKVSYFTRRPVTQNRDLIVQVLKGSAVHTPDQFSDQFVDQFTVKLGDGEIIDLTSRMENEFGHKMLSVSNVSTLIHPFEVELSGFAEFAGQVKRRHFIILFDTVEELVPSMWILEP